MVVEGSVFASRDRGTVIAKGLKIVGSVTAEGLVEVGGQIEGEVHCTSLIVSRGAHVRGTIAAERVVVDGVVEGPIQGGEVILKSQARVVGDIYHQSLAIERGAYFDGRSQRGLAGDGQEGEKIARRPIREITQKEREVAAG
jgi:cytoskeletal protein CcmA (bactofilin family)